MMETIIKSKNNFSVISDPQYIKFITQKLFVPILIYMHQHSEQKLRVKKFTKKGLLFSFNKKFVSQYPSGPSTIYNWYKKSKY